MLRFRPGVNDYSVKLNQVSVSFCFDYKPKGKAIIIFLHGLGCSRDSFRNVFDFPYFPDYSLLIPDLIGFGLSSKPETFDYTMEAQANLCARLIGLFPSSDLHLVAHSMGNVIALLLVAEISDKLKSYASLEGNLISADCGLLSRGIVGGSFDHYRTRGFSRQQQLFACHPELRFHQTTETAVYKSAQSLVSWSDSGELLEKFKALKCKKSYFWGEENRNMPILPKLNFVQTYMIPGSGHGMMTDNPKAFYNTLSEFIN